MRRFTFNQSFFQRQSAHTDRIARWALELVLLSSIWAVMGRAFPAYGDTVGDWLVLTCVVLGATSIYVCIVRAACDASVNIAPRSEMPEEPRWTEQN